jgi:hypothetical protein
MSTKQQHTQSHHSFTSQSQEYYGTLAKEVYAIAKKENWGPEKVKSMLQNPRDFEKYL